MAVKKRQSAQEIIQEKADRMMAGMAKWVGFYRCNPHRFAKDFLNLKLRLFQKIILYAMMHNNYMIYLAARGQGICVLPCINRVKSVKFKV